VEFDDVSYRYLPGRFALRGVSLHAPAGSTTALVGPNGSGKSTLCRLLLAYDRPSAGRILIDGRDLAALDRRSYRSRLGVVLQDDVLFDGTIADNIRYGRPRASLTDVQAAGRLAHCDEFVTRLPDGYSTLVGERGLRLSAGQRQRVAIARAFLVDPRILLLDEATSSLDTESEGLIQDALRFLCRGRTTFVIAHRLTTVRNADQILVLDQGAVAERGTHEELVAERGQYFRLYEAQAHATSDWLVAPAERTPAPFPARHAKPVRDPARGNGRAH
jgi:ABC-type multidrug transport system fused ATPase/permease subunit